CDLARQSQRSPSVVSYILAGHETAFSGPRFALHGGAAWRFHRANGPRSRNFTTPPNRNSSTASRYSASHNRKRTPPLTAKPPNTAITPGFGRGYSDRGRCGPYARSSVIVEISAARTAQSGLRPGD